MSLVSITDCRARRIALPLDDAVAQDLIDDEEAWLARQLGGPLTGDRTETFYVGIGATIGKLSLLRYTDNVVLEDGGIAVPSGGFRLVDRGSAVIHTYQSAQRAWTGPYTTATYAPNDEAEIRRALFGFIALSAVPLTPYESEVIGAYSYTKGNRATIESNSAVRAALVASLRPKRDKAATFHTSLRIVANDPLINNPEPIYDPTVNRAEMDSVG